MFGIKAVKTIPQVQKNPGFEVSDRLALDEIRDEYLYIEGYALL